MAYAIERGETISTAIPRIVIERIDAAYEQLRDGREKPEERIHNARKRFKEARAAIRLVREPLGGTRFGVENDWFRDAGRDLAVLRDADARLETIARLQELADGFHDRRVLRHLRRRMQRRRRAGEFQALVTNAAQQLPVAKARVTMWPLLDDGFATVGEGLERTYRDGRRAFHRAVLKPSPETFHEWRKRVKDHWYHAQILRHVRPDVMKPYREEMEILSDALGDRHDLDVLRHLVTSDAARFGSAFDLRVLYRLIDTRADELSASAVAIGERVYSDAPIELAKRFQTWWDSFQGAAARC